MWKIGLYIYSLSLLCISSSFARPSSLGHPLAFEYQESLSSFFNQLQTLIEEKQKRIRITHIGDSHVIADFWTGSMRKRLQERWGDGGRGYVMGGRMWRSFSQRHIYHYTKGEWTTSNLKRGHDDGWFGPGGGFLINTPQSESTGVYTKAGTASQFDELIVYTLGTPQGGRFNLQVDHRPFGEFSTFTPFLEIQGHRTRLNDAHHHVKIVPNPQDPPLRLFGFDLLRSQGGIVYDSIGLNGAKARHLLKNQQNAFEQGLKALKSDLLVLSYGINELFDRNWDIKIYKRDLHSVLTLFRQALPNTGCLLTGPFTALRRGKPLVEMEMLYQIQKEFAQEFKCAFWNTRDVMYRDLRPWQRRRLARKDGVHLSRKGYELIASLLEESLLLTYQIWKQGQPLSQVQALKTNTDRTR